MSMNFGEAIAALKRGESLQRKGWNDKNTFIELQTPDEHSKMTRPYIYFDTTGLYADDEYALRTLVPWLASQSDMLAEDWQVIIID